MGFLGLLRMYKQNPIVLVNKNQISSNTCFVLLENTEFPPNESELTRLGKKSGFFWSRVVACKRCTTYVGISVVRVVGVALGSEEARKFGGRERERKRLSCSLERIESECLLFLTSIRASDHDLSCFRCSHAC